MSSATPVPAHRRLALFVGLRLVWWACRSRHVEPARSAPDHAELLRRHRVAQQVERDRERAVAQAIMYTRRVM